MRKISKWAVIDTGARPNFGCRGKLPSTEVHIKYGDEPIISDVNGRALKIVSTATLFVWFSSYVFKVEFYV